MKIQISIDTDTMKVVVSDNSSIGEHVWKLDNFEICKDIQEESDGSGFPVRKDSGGRSIFITGCVLP